MQTAASKPDLTAAHTPGPWRVAPASDYAGCAINVDAGTQAYICHAGHRGDAEAEANARLIAAAPVLLAALKRIIALESGTATDDQQDWDMAIDSAIKVIAKAEGR